MVREERLEQEITYDHIIGNAHSRTWPVDTLDALNHKVIAITGGAGSIGSEVAKFLILNTNSQIWLLDNDESRLHTKKIQLENLGVGSINMLVFDIKDPTSVNLHLSRISPHIIVHAAALKHVPILENQPRDGYMTNVLGLLHVIDYLKTNRSCRLCFISSDKAANPKSVLGKTKLIGEQLVAGLVYDDKKLNQNKVHNVVRFGNVFMSRGSVVETFIHQLTSDLPVTITNPEMKRYFMDVKEAAKLICFSMAAEIPGISILKMGDPVSILEIAKRIAKRLDVQEFDVIEIGQKPGEKLNEDLFSDLESSLINDLGDVLNTDFNRFLLSNQITREISNDTEALGEIDRLLADGKTYS